MYNYLYRPKDHVLSGAMNMYVGQVIFLLCSAPSPPIALQSLKTTPTTIHLIWDPPSSSGGTLVTSYLVKYSQGGPYFHLAWASKTSHNITRLQPGTNYTVEVSAKNLVGFSQPVTITVQTSECYIIREWVAKQLVYTKFPSCAYAQGGLNDLLRLSVSLSVSTEQRFGTPHLTQSGGNNWASIICSAGMHGFDEHGPYSEQILPLAALPWIGHFVHVL